ncbi:MAG TPA: alpha-ketoglutarate-dependent dioxygenase AlkB [Cytophagales bacterium]|nr:alpha-ketoglutarate-dependent dioxygenase AlkB [Cytophagales bacterium]HAA22407.1 alpha-ketoglutarate-dependent dioxygenase AlkB [Cytophagales bacterium]HAP65125.1 alpha-ketoglutarate-dependent dioxygenase AlkB [Cytophagales bacterium]
MILPGIQYFESFLEEAPALLENLVAQAAWETSMQARWTASYGVPYNYSQMTYPERAFLPQLEIVRQKVALSVGFQPNNCLLNYYQDGKSKMGFHSDETKNLVTGCGIAIVSLGGTRTLRFRQIADPSVTTNLSLVSGSLVYMSQEVQHTWQHAIPKAPVALPRISLTFRRFQREN